MIIPVYRNGVRCKPDNYRPINHTLVTFRIMERLIKGSVIAYILKHGIINTKQHGFLRKNHMPLAQLTT